MFKTKKSKMKIYLNEKKDISTPFDHLLTHYLSGELKNRLNEMGLQHISIYIDWHLDYKCINIQGRYLKNYVEIQIEPTRFSIGCDPDEPDEHSEFFLENQQQFYNVMTAQLAAVPKDERHG